MKKKDSEKVKVLVAEDNPVNQKVVMRMLRQAGYQYTLASNGKEAVDILLVTFPTLQVC